MKKIVFPLLFFCLSSAGLVAQEDDSSYEEAVFNKWSIDVHGGFNKVANPMTEGYFVKLPNPFHVDLGVRYMFNTKFGLKLDVGYDQLKGDKDGGSLDFKTKVMRLDFQGYANLGRIMEFESWTRRLGLLGHMGVGVGQFTGDRFEGTDHIGNMMIGLTGQYKISERVAFNADFTMINTFTHHKTWDGGIYHRDGHQGFDGTLYNASIGLSIYLGKNEKHADWYVEEKDQEVNDLEDRIGELEKMMDDADKDGVPDYLDAEPNTIAGIAVDTKGRTIDRNENGVPDELESYIETKNAEVKKGVSADIADLINGGYVNVYFDFNAVQPNAQSVNGINFLVKYLKDNPEVSADVIGYADEVGDTAYNRNLSQKRAETVKQILVDAGINASRLNIVANGEDGSVNKDSKYARQIVRRVTFILK